MIVLDTNVISEAMKPEPAIAVRQWLDIQAAETLYLTAVTQAEVLFGIAKLPSGRKKERLASVFAGVERLFTGRILPFDSDAAFHYARLPPQPEAMVAVSRPRTATLLRSPRLAALPSPRATQRRSRPAD